MTYVLGNALVLVGVRGRRTFVARDIVLVLYNMVKMIVIRVLVRK